MDNNVEIISLKYIKNIIPKRLMNKFEMYNLNTVQDIKNISIDEFMKYKSVGINIVDDFIKIKKIIDEQPNLLIENVSYKKYDIKKIEDKILNIELKYLKTIIPKRLQNKLELCACNNINDVFQLDFNDFASRESVGTKCIEDLNNFKDNVYNNGNYIFDTYNNNKEYIIPNDFNNNFLILIKTVIDEYFALSQDIKGKDVVYKRFALIGKKKYTLEELGMYYDITRERIRQIQDKHIKKLELLLSGDALKKPYCVLDQRVIDSFDNIKSIVKKYDIITQVDLKNEVKQFLIYDKKSENLFDLVIFLCGGIRYYFENVSYYIFNNSINNNLIEIACNNVISILRDEVKPITFFDLVIKIKKKNKKINKDIIESILKIIPYIENVDDFNSKKLQIKFYKLNSYADYAFRILYEKHEIMHYSEIWREIQHRLVKEKQEVRDSQHSFKNQLVSDKRFSPIGKTGSWGLKEWNNDSSSIIELILKAFHHYNEPCTINEIAKYVSEIRPQVKQHSIYSIMSQHKDKILKTEKNKFIPKEWSSQYPNTTEMGDISERISMHDFCEILIEINSKYKQEKYSIKQLKQILSEYNIFWEENYCHIKFTSCPILIKEKKERKLYFIIDETAFNERSKPLPKLELLKNKIIKIIQENDRELLELQYLANRLKNEGELKPNVYTVISRNPDIFAKIKRGNTVYIKLQKIKIDEKIIKDKSIHISRIDKGENRLTEFKSSLRWDLKEKCVNKELEFMVVKAITAFLNTEGGILYIGVDDDGNILGLESDYKTFSKKNRDGFLLHLNNLLIKNFSKSVFTYVEPNIEKIKNKDVAIVDVKKSVKPVFIKEENIKCFFIRGSASVQKLDLEETAGYIISNW